MSAHPICDGLPPGSREKCLRQAATAVIVPPPPAYVPPPAPTSITVQPTEAPANIPAPCAKPSWFARALSVAKVLSSPDVDDQTKAARDLCCHGCEHLRRIGEQRFCGCCHCPHWRLADLDVKNRKQAWACPAEKF